MLRSLSQVTRCAARSSLRASPLMASSRGYKFLNVDVNKEKGVGVVSMNKPPVNSLNLELLTELNIVFSKLEDDPGCRGVVLTSDMPKIFCAGLDIMEMYQPEPERLRQFWKSLQDFWQTLYSSSLITIAAINGNSPAGGCLLSLGCDYRIMAEGNFSIGLNETKLGIVAPLWFQHPMINTVGQRMAELSLQLGLMFPNTEALNIGLVDSLVPEDKVKVSALSEMDKWLTIPDLPRIISKSQLRAPTLEKFVEVREADLENFVTFIQGPAVQKSLGKYMEKLKQKS